MRFSSLLLPLAVLSGSLAKSQPKRQLHAVGQATPARRAPTSPNVSSLDKRQLPGELIGVTLCAELNADVNLDVGLAGILGLGQLLGLGVNEDLCICIAGGVLTDASVAQIRAIVEDDTLVVLALLNVISVNAAVDAIVDALVVLLGLPAYEDTCGFPDNSVPIGCNTCDFECADGFTRCGDQCLVTCPSGIPAAGPGGGTLRRRLHGLGASADLLCSKGRSACGIVAPGKGGSMLVRGKFECLDTASDVENCGGCIVPLAGRPQGIDCTALPFVSDVACMQGRCAIHACENGYKAVGNQCVEIKSNVGDGESAQSLLGLDLQLAADLGLGVLKA